jgi:hypothetical protein
MRGFAAVAQVEHPKTVASHFKIEYLARDVRPGAFLAPTMP